MYCRLILKARFLRPGDLARIEAHATSRGPTKKAAAKKDSSTDAAMRQQVEGVVYKVHPCVKPIFLITALKRFQIHES